MTLSLELRVVALPEVFRLGFLVSKDLFVVIVSIYRMFRRVYQTFKYALRVVQVLRHLARRAIRIVPDVLLRAGRVVKVLVLRK